MTGIYSLFGSIFGVAIIGATVSLIFSLLKLLFNMFVYSKIFNKAGESSWKAYIPIYNIAILSKISNLSPYWVCFYVLYVLTNFIDCSAYIKLGLSIIWLVFSIILNIKLSKSFDLSIPFAIGMILFPTIFYAILAFGPFYYTRTKKQQQAYNAFNLNTINNSDYIPKSDFFKD